MTIDERVLALLQTNDMAGEVRAIIADPSLNVTGPAVFVRACQEILAVNPDDVSQGGMIAKLAAIHAFLDELTDVE